MENTALLSLQSNALASPFLTIKEAAAYLRLSVSKLYKLSQKRKIKHRMHGKKLLFLKSELDSWSAEQTKEIDAVHCFKDLEKDAKFQLLLKGRRCLKNKDQNLDKP